MAIEMVSSIQGLPCMMTSGDLSDGVDDNGGPGNSMQYVASNKKAKTVMCFNWVQAERIL